MKTKLTTTLCILLILFSFSILFSSCSENELYGIVGADINENGELILTYSNGTEQNLGVIVGQDGIDGKDGADGKDGMDGKDGKDGMDGTNGSNSSGSSDAITNNDISAASAKGLRSAVSIVCNFQTNVQQGGWRPGSSSTTTKEYYSEGSGVIYQMNQNQGSAFIITNYHVVYDASSNTENGISDDISVYLYGAEIEEKAIEATYVGGSLYYDIAILSVENNEILKASDACAVTIANSDKILVGNSAIAIGNAQGLGISSTSGIVSVDSEYITMTAADGKTEVSFRVMRVDTAINSGNSGGGLYDGEGNLIGIVNAKIVYDGVENIGYAIPSNVVQSIAENIIDYCHGTDTERVQRALLGITVSITDSKAVYNTDTGMITIEESVSVYDVSENSLADGVLQAEDILVSASINSQTTQITRQYHIIDMMLDVRVGDTVTLTILRNGEEKTVTFSITADCLTEY